MAETATTPAGTGLPLPTAREPADGVQRWLERLPWSPLLTSAAVAAGVGVLGAGLHVAALRWWHLPPFRLSPAALAVASSVNVMLLGALLAATSILARGVRRDLTDLRVPLALDGAALEDAIRAVTTPRLRVRRLATLVGAASGAGVYYLDPVVSAIHRDVAPWDPRSLFMLAHNMVFLILGMRLFVTEVHMTRCYARLGRHRVQVDLVDPRPLAAFGRKGQRSVVVWTVLSAIFSLFWLNDSAAAANVAVPVFLVALMGTAFLAPALGVRHRIHEARDRELTRVAAQIRRQRESLSAPGADGAPGGGRLADLLTWRRLVQEVQEWPFDAPALVRAALFAALGVGSWLGGALVERLVDALLR